MVKKISLLLLVVLLASACTLTKRQRRANKAINKLEKLKLKYHDVWDSVSVTTVRLDTVIRELEVRGETVVVADTAAVDSLLVEIERLLSSDPEVIIRNIPIEVIRNVLIKAAPQLIKAEPVSIDTLDISMEIALVNGIIAYNIVRDTIKITLEEKVDKFNVTQTTVIKGKPWKFWWFWLMLLIILFLGYLHIKPRLPPIRFG